MQTVSKIQPIFAIQPDSSNNASNSTIPSPNPTTLRKRVMKKHYRLTSNEQRARLIAVMTRSRKTIREVSEELDIPYSTAKTILRIYQNEGRVQKKRRSRMLQPFPKPSFSYSEQARQTATPTPSQAHEKSRTTVPLGTILSSSFWAAKLTEHFVTGGLS